MAGCRAPASGRSTSSYFITFEGLDFLAALCSQDAELRQGDHAAMCLPDYAAGKVTRGAAPARAARAARAGEVRRLADRGREGRRRQCAADLLAAGAAQPAGRRRGVLGRRGAGGADPGVAAVLRHRPGAHARARPAARHGRPAQPCRGHGAGRSGHDHRAGRPRRHRAGLRAALRVRPLARLLLRKPRRAVRLAADRDAGRDLWRPSSSPRRPWASRARSFRRGACGGSSPSR